jgi:hypothetical protein
MQGLYYALSVLAIAIVIQWCRTADRGRAGEYVGLLAMRRPTAAPPSSRKMGSRRKVPRNPA